MTLNLAWWVIIVDTSSRASDLDTLRSSTIITTVIIIFNGNITASTKPVTGEPFRVCVGSRYSGFGPRMNNPDAAIAVCDSLFLYARAFFFFKHH